MTHQIILGIDEVGRGPWAGPLVVGAVILQNSTSTNLQPSSSETSEETKPNLWQGLNDSKKLTAERRSELNRLITKNAAAYATGWVSAHELDHYGLSAALKLATRRAVKQILAQKVHFDHIIIDGTVNFLQNTPLENRVSVLKKADSLIPEVSAASIIAKVARDNYMVELSRQYPNYGFEKHVGYGTALHKTAILQHGICSEHRQSFRPIRDIISQNSSEPLKSPECCKIYNIKSAPNTTSKGRKAENLVAKHLESLGHTIIAHNFKTKTYEIDLISIKADQIFFTEVKYRQNNHHGSALSQITPNKQKQMHYAAEKFLSNQQSLIPEHLKEAYSHFQPFLAVAAVEENYVLKDWFILT